MKTKDFLDRLDDARVVGAIHAAERRTSGEIRVFVSKGRLGRADVLAQARVRFERLGMTSTAARNGVLFYFVPRDQAFAVIGDAGIDAVCGAGFWEDVAADLREDLRRGDFTTAVVNAIARAGEKLAEHFPRRGDDRDELSNEVTRD